MFFMLQPQKPIFICGKLWRNEFVCYLVFHLSTNAICNFIPDYSYSLRSKFNPVFSEQD